MVMIIIKKVLKHTCSFFMLIDDDKGFSDMIVGLKGAYYFFFQNTKKKFKDI